MSRVSYTIEQILTMLAQAPPRITALTAGCHPGQLLTAPAPGEWSANEVLAHIRACADVWGGCIKEIITHDRSVVRAVNPRTWIKSTDYLEMEFHPSLQAYTEQRSKLVVVLQALTPADWSRSASVTGAGAPLERTAFFYAQWLARHERPHLKQIARIVAR